MTSDGDSWHPSSSDMDDEDNDEEGIIKLLEFHEEFSQSVYFHLIENVFEKIRQGFDKFKQNEDQFEKN